MAHADAATSHCPNIATVCKLPRKSKGLRVQQAAEPPKKRTLNAAVLLRDAATLPDAEIESLIEALHGLLDARKLEAEPEPESGGDRQSTASKGQGGHFVRKMINNCGPYQYLRFRSGGKYRSVYLGKAKEA